MTADLVRLLPAIAFAILLLVAAIYDIIQRRIPNWTVVVLILLEIVLLMH